MRTHILLTCTLWYPNIDVANPWFPQENSLQSVDFPHLYQFTLGYLPLSTSWDIHPEHEFHNGVGVSTVSTSRRSFLPWPLNQFQHHGQHVSSDCDTGQDGRCLEDGKPKRINQWEFQDPKLEVR